jgi:hypothetical protein
MPLSSSSVDRRIPEAVSTSRENRQGSATATGFRPCRAKAGKRSRASITRKSHSSTRVGALARSSLSTDAEARRQVNPAVLSECEGRQLLALLGPRGHVGFHAAVGQSLDLLTLSGLSTRWLRGPAATLSPWRPDPLTYTAKSHLIRNSVTAITPISGDSWYGGTMDSKSTFTK